MKNPAKPKGTYADWKNGDTEGKVFVFELLKNNKDTSIMTTAAGKPVMFNLSTPIPMIGTVYCKKRKAPRRIRFVQGEDSIFIDEQTSDKDVPKIKTHANFVNGRKILDGQTDIIALNFFMNWDINDTNPDRDTKKTPRFYLMDKSKVVDKAKAAYKAEFNAVKWCDEAEPDQLMTVAAMKLSPEQLVQPIGDIRWDMTTIARKDPAKFLELITDPKTERRCILNKALNKNIISINSQHNSIAWSDNPNAPLTVAPAGKDILEDFINKSFSGDGERYYRAIEEQVIPSKPVEEAVRSYVPQPEKQVFEKPMINTSGASTEEITALVKSAYEKELIIQKGAWREYKGVKAQGDDALVQKLRDNPTIIELLKKDVLG